MIKSSSGNGRKRNKNGKKVMVTIVFLQEPNDLLQHGSLVHLPSVARQHGAELFDEDIELVPTLLLRLVSGSSVKTKSENVSLLLMSDSLRPHEL